MLSKSQITQQILLQLPDNDRPSFEQAMKSWWQDIRTHSGLRLSISGYDAFSRLQIEQHQFDVPKNSLHFSRHLVTLNKKLPCPYYILVGKNSKLIIFGSDQAVIYALYGDLEKFLAYLQRT